MIACVLFLYLCSSIVTFCISISISCGLLCSMSDSSFAYSPRTLSSVVWPYVVIVSLGVCGVCGSGFVFVIDCITCCSCCTASALSFFSSFGYHHSSLISFILPNLGFPSGVRF